MSHYVKQKNVQLEIVFQLDIFDFRFLIPAPTGIKNLFRRKIHIVYKGPADDLYSVQVKQGLQIQHHLL